MEPITKYQICRIRDQSDTFKFCQHRAAPTGLIFYFTNKHHILADMSNEKLNLELK